MSEQPPAAPLPTYDAPAPLPQYNVEDLPVTKSIPVPPESLATPGKRLGGALLSGVLMIVTLGIGYLIWAIIVWKQSTTPAKKILGMKVVNAKTGADCTMNEMVMRQVVWGIVIAVGSGITGVLGIVDALFVFSGTRQRLIDRMANTLVINVPK